MPSYYEVLKIEPTASTQEIEVAIDDQYSQFRHLVNHQNPEVVEQANRSLRLLEQIRSTLTEPDKRALYDQTLNFGGLADPSALVQSAGVPGAMMTPPPPRSAPQAELESTTAWKCDQCGKLNRIGSKICSKCGKVLARDCPNGCGNVVLLSEVYCSNCAANIEDALATLQTEFEQTQKNAVNAVRLKIQSKRNELDRLNWFAENVPLRGTNQELNSLVGEELTAGLGGGYAMVLVTVAFVAGSIGGSIGGRGGGSFLGLLFLVGALVGGYFLLHSAVVKPRFVEAIDRAVSQRNEYIRHAERRLQEEQAKRFDPMSPKPYSTTG